MSPAVIVLAHLIVIAAIVAAVYWSPRLAPAPRLVAIVVAIVFVLALGWASDVVAAFYGLRWH